MSEEDAINTTIEHLFHVRRKLAKYRAYEDSLKMKIQSVMGANHITVLESDDFICYKQIKTQKCISKSIPIEIIEPYYETKQYSTLKVVPKGST